MGFEGCRWCLFFVGPLEEGGGEGGGGGGRGVVVVVCVVVVVVGGGGGGGNDNITRLTIFLSPTKSKTKEKKRKNKTPPHLWPLNFSTQQPTTPPNDITKKTKTLNFPNSNYMKNPYKNIFSQQNSSC